MNIIVTVNGQTPITVASPEVKPVSVNPVGGVGPKGDAGAPGSDGADGADGTDGAGVAAGGSVGQLLQKQSGTDYDTDWTPVSLPTSDIGAIGSFFIRTAAGVMSFSAFRLPLVDGSSGQVLKTNGSGTVSFQDDLDTTYTAGDGIVLNGTEFSVDYIGVTNVVTQASAYTSQSLSGSDDRIIIHNDDTGEVISIQVRNFFSLYGIDQDITPKLGGDLDVVTNKIISSFNRDIAIEPNGTGDVLLGNMKFDADQSIGLSEDNYVLTYDHSVGKISLEEATGGSSGIIEYYASWQNNTANALYIPLAGNSTAESSAGQNFLRSRIIARAGSVTSVIFWSIEGAGDVLFQVYKGGVLQETSALQTVTTGGIYTFTFSSNTFAAGDILDVEIDPNPGWTTSGTHTFAAVVCYTPS